MTFAERYRKTFRYPRPSLTVDLVIFTIVDCRLRLLLVRRKEEPFRGRWALPGGFVHVGDAFRDQGEDLEAAAHRELREETGLSGCYLEQLYTFGDAGRDPRMRIISVAYYALVRPDLAPIVRAGSDAADVRWVDLDALPKLAFDHAKIVEKAVHRLRGKLDYTTIAFELVPETFTVAELRRVHEIIKGTAYDPANFRRKFLCLLETRVIEEAPGRRLTATRPARVYRFRRG
jgi:8-oxo-dGTP diphosphatase